MRLKQFQTETIKSDFLSYFGRWYVLNNELSWFGKITEIFSQNWKRDMRVIQDVYLGDLQSQGKTSKAPGTWHPAVLTYLNIQAHIFDAILCYLPSPHLSPWQYDSLIALWLPSPFPTRSSLRDKERDFPAQYFNHSLTHLHFIDHLRILINIKLGFVNN